MNQSARVASIEALKDFKAALLNFCERARHALCAVQMESRRTLDWLLHDQLNHWQNQVRERQEDVVQARTDLNRVKLARVSGREPDCIEQKQALREAQARLHEALDKVQRVQRWARQVQRAIDEYEGQAQRLAELVEGDPPCAVSLLNRMIDSLDSYVTLAPQPQREDG